jgi:hypothetical protein
MTDDIKLVVFSGLLLAACALCGYAGWQWRDYQAQEDQLEQAELANQALEAEIARVVDLTNRLRSVEDASRAELVEINNRHERSLRDVVAEKDRTIRNLRNGLLSLRDPYPQGAPAQAGDSGSAAGTTPGVVLPEGGARLSAGLAEYLVGEASRADGVVHDLNYCRAVAVEQHNTCNSLLREAFGD